MPHASRNQQIMNLLRFIQENGRSNNASVINSVQDVAKELARLVREDIEAINTAVVTAIKDMVRKVRTRVIINGAIVGLTRGAEEDISDFFNGEMVYSERSSGYMITVYNNHDTYNIEFRVERRRRRTVITMDPDEEHRVDREIEITTKVIHRDIELALADPKSFKMVVMRKLNLGYGYEVRFIARNMLTDRRWESETTVPFPPLFMPTDVDLLIIAGLLETMRIGINEAMMYIG